MRGTWSRVAGVVLGAIALALLVGLSVDALTPRADWRAPPRFRSDPVFLPTVGVLRWDKAAHAVSGAGLGLLGALGLRLGTGVSLGRSALIALGYVGAWALMLETTQGFLAYRNFELLDLAATLLGGTVAVAIPVAAASWFRRPARATSPHRKSKP